jgi:hypothetical protein
VADIRFWERLSDVLARVMAACGLPADQAKTAICRAIAGAVVKSQAKLGSHATRGTTASKVVLAGDCFHIPPDIKPADLDWEASRPIKPWPVRHGRFQQPGYWYLAWIELCSSGVAAVCAAVARGEATEQASSENDPAGTSEAPPQRTNITLGRDLRSASAPREPGAVGPPRRRGRRPKIFEQTRDAMRNDIQEGRCTAAQLDDMPEKIISERYGVSRDTARRARTEALSELDED